MRFSLHVPFHVPQSVSSKKHLFFFFRFGVRFSAPSFRPVGVRRVRHPSRALLVRVSGFPYVLFCVGCPHTDFVRAENSTACVVSVSAPVVSGGGKVHGAGVNCFIAQLRWFRVFHWFDYRVWIVTSWSVIADLTSIAHSIISGQRSVTRRRCNTDRLIATYYRQWRAHCRRSLVRQFWGKCPLLSVTRQAILGQVPVAIRHLSGNFGASAHCRSSLVRQFRGKCPLPSVACQAISGQVPTAVHRSSGNFGAGAHCRPLLIRRFFGASAHCWEALFSRDWLPPGSPSLEHTFWVISVCSPGPTWEVQVRFLLLPSGSAKSTSVFPLKGRFYERTAIPFSFT